MEVRARACAWCSAQDVCEPEWQNYHATRLLLFRQAIDQEPGYLQDVDVIAVIEGTTLDVRCSVPGCGASRTWWIGEAAMEKLMERTNK